MLKVFYLGQPIPTEIVIPLFYPTVCYFPDYDLIREDPQPAVANTYNTSGFYLSVSTPSRCKGIADFIEACAELLSTNPEINNYVFYVNIFRNNGRSLYEQVGREIRSPLNGLDEPYICHTRNLSLNDQWTVKKGDVVGAEVLGECEINHCFSYAVFNPSMIIPNHTLDYVATTARTSFIQMGEVTATPGFLNVRAHVGEPTYIVA